ncbi:hypothetical protein ABZS83_14100 [Streptomyces sp. NPDC005426]|uniref:hypothetical protein n=1 Tax=Streptomyces sp. NPDC005426 TaxID=3155344 RepID=UPI0033B0A1FF
MNSAPSARPAPSSGRTAPTALAAEAAPAPARRTLLSTRGTRLRAGLPPEWTVADQTGGGSYGGCNDVGTAWTPDGTPVVPAAPATKPAADAATDHPRVARAAAVLAAEVVS